MMKVINKDIAGHEITGIVPDGENSTVYTLAGLITLQQEFLNLPAYKIRIY